MIHTWQQLTYIHGLGAELPSHVFNPDKQVYHSLNTQQLSLGFSGSLLPRPSRDTLREGGMGQEKLTIVFNALAG